MTTVPPHRVLVTTAPPHSVLVFESSDRVSLFESPGFGGRSVSLGIGQHRFFTADDFNDLASSVQVPAGLVVILYGDADEGGGYGISVDLLEDSPNLSVYNFDNKASYVTVFATTTSAGLVWARAVLQNGMFVPGHWERRRADGQGPPNPGFGTVAPPIPSHAPPVITSIQVSGTKSVITSLGAQSQLERGYWEHAVTDQFGVIGSDFREAEEIGSAAFERASNNPVIPDSINFWYPQMRPRDHRGRYFKSTLIGTVDDVHLASIGGTYEDHDLNILIAPDELHKYMVTEAHPREYTDIMSAEWRLTLHHYGQPDCDDDTSIREVDFVEAEILPSSDFNSGVNEGLRNRIAAAGNRRIGVYGPWIYDKGHCCHAEIHPAEQIWWREDSDSRTIYHFNVICDASKRFWWRDQMDDGTKLKPWGAPPVRGLFAIAFEVDPPSPISRISSSEVFEVSDISSYNVASIPGGKPIYELTYQGATLVTFIPNNEAFSASFEQVGTAEDGKIRGFLVMETSVGKLTQTVVDANFPAGTNVNSIDQDNERRVFSKEEGHYMYAVSQHLSRAGDTTLGS
jgi:hypothetical protein